MPESAPAAWLEPGKKTRYLQECGDRGSEEAGEALTGSWLCIRRSSLGNSLAVQWLGLCTSTAGGTGSISGWGTMIPHAVWLVQKIKTAFGWSDVKGAVLASGKVPDGTMSTKGLQKAWRPMPHSLNRRQRDDQNSAF